MGRQKWGACLRYLTSHESRQSIASRHSKRPRDPVRARIDELVSGIMKTPHYGLQVVYMCDLYFALDYWLRINKISVSNRESGVVEFYEKVAHALCDVFGCSINVLPRELSNAFARQLSDRGVYVDLEQKEAVYFDEARRREAKLIFRNGLVYRLPLFVNEGPGLVALNSSPFHSDPAWPDNHGGYVLSMGRDFYMTRHASDLFHSAYIAGGETQCAGTMEIEDGVVRALSNLSGHYKPHVEFLTNALLALRMHGIEIASISVICYLDAENQVTVPATHFLRVHNTLARLIERLQANRQFRRNEFRKTRARRKFNEIRGSGEWGPAFTQALDELGMTRDQLRAALHI
jgi:hypothetical protein